jgi:hypothetical protein
MWSSMASTNLSEFTLDFQFFEYIKKIGQIAEFCIIPINCEVKPFLWIWGNDLQSSGRVL